MLLLKRGVNGCSVFSIVTNGTLFWKNHHFRKKLQLQIDPSHSFVCVHRYCKTSAQETMGCCVSNENPQNSDANVQEKKIYQLESLPKIPTSDIKVQQLGATETCMSETEVEEIMILETQLKKN